jgi:hypothetical protein
VRPVENRPPTGADDPNRGKSSGDSLDFELPRG